MRRTLILLASQSPRRRELLSRLGIPFRWIHPGVDDAELVHSRRVSPASWVASLAYLKARAGSKLDVEQGHEPLVLGADTVCVNEGQLLGQPRDADDAERMIRAMAGRTHEVLTGVALLIRRDGGLDRSIFVDRALVEVGVVSDELVTEYIASGSWRGKAGAYNLSERLAAGWPIRVTGSHESVMGLPIERLASHPFMQSLANK